MSNHVPVAGGVLSIIGSVFVLLAGAALAVLGSFLSFFIGGLAGLFYIGLLIGVLMLIFSILIFVMPSMKTAWGALVIVLAIASLPFALGGFIIGFILALIGGILTLVHKSTPAMAAPMPGQPVAMACPACGGMVNPQTRTCTACGRQV